MKILKQEPSPGLKTSRIRSFDFHDVDNVTVVILFFRFDSNTRALAIILRRSHDSIVRRSLHGYCSQFLLAHVVLRRRNILRFHLSFHDPGYEILEPCHLLLYHWLEFGWRRHFNGFVPGGYLIQYYIGDGWRRSGMRFIQPPGQRIAPDQYQAYGSGKHQGLLKPAVISLA